MDGLKVKALKACFEKGAVNYDGRLSPPFQDLFVSMAEEIDCLKRRIDILEKKKNHPTFGEQLEDPD